MPPPPPPTYDWKKGSVFVQDGTIYYSPNSKSPVKITPPTLRQPHPFLDAQSLDARSFKHPVWWTDNWGWMSFIPLSPSFITLPFRPFCWMPPIEEKVLTSSEKSRPKYRMNPTEAELWKTRERDLLEVVLKMRLWYHVPASQPPPPSHFKYDIYYPTREQAIKQITLAREWFAVWMGLLSYFIARAKYAENCVGSMVPNVTDVLPKWYTRLQKDLGISSAWLDGIRFSTVCQFNQKTPRAGIVFPWYEYEKNRPNVDFFIDHCIPVFFPWCAVAEDTILRNRSLEYLKPPPEMVRAALEKFLGKYSSSRLPLAALIFRTYFAFHKLQWYGTKHIVNMEFSTSEVFHYMQTEYASQHDKIEEVLAEDALKETEEDLQTIVHLIKEDQRIAAEELVNKLQENFKPLDTIPETNLEEIDFGDAFDVDNAADEVRNCAVDNGGNETDESWTSEDEGKSLIQSVEAFLEKRRLGQDYIIQMTETRTQSVKRLARERTRPIEMTKMFVWREKTSSQGKIVYVRQRVQPSSHIDKYSSCPLYRRIYNAFDNEWDLLKEIDVPPKWIQGNIEGTDIQADEHIMDGDIDEVEEGEEAVGVAIEVAGEHADIVCDKPSYHYSPTESYDSVVGHTTTSAEIGDCQDILQSLFYSYGFLPSTMINEQDGRADNWARCLYALGFNKNGIESAVSKADRHSIAVFRDAVVNNQPIPREICDLVPGNSLALGDLVNLRIVHRPSTNMFVFSHDDIRAPHEMMERMTVDWHVAVETSLAALYVCRLFVHNRGHSVYTVARVLLEKGVPFRTLIGRDKRGGLLQVTQPYKTRSCYRGISHVFGAEDFNASMSACEEVLNQIHGWAALLMGGIVGRIAKDYLSLDAGLQGPSLELTEHGVGFITNSGSDWVPYCDDGLTEYEIMTIVGAYTLMTNFSKQTSVKSWFPPPHIWDDYRNGSGGVEWTEKNEEWYLARVEAIRAGNAQPKTMDQWKQVLRNRFNRDFQVNVRAIADDFVDQNIPVSGRM